MENFFRYNVDGSASINIMLIRLALIFSIIFAYYFRNSETLLKWSLNLGTAIQLLMLYWYLGNVELFLKEGLPLFHCRLSAIMMFFGYYTNSQKITKYFSWLGVIGAIIAFTFPDPSPYVWPHVTNVTFVGSHIFLVISGVIIINKKNIYLSTRDTLKLTFIMNTILMTTNLLIHSNYGYLSELPTFIGIKLPRAALFFLMTMCISLIIIMLEKKQSDLQSNN
ncbi:conserved hypothetical integral membrane protein TIGR02206 [Peptoniphilus asaccharolyticus DSM 20463]|uniref:Conserved hypothetical integral membrane protein TIGR02206 n=1 Tax=Peptoniphilus asaccharolyticus DSM 20463 TaxID=573058 RepID=A0A1W1VE18_PEPAS|nr:YwaF family protein [Peptoniphilus asaccharolyticus]SMB91618.1 conserved hypothetical integral membrane protein TIGR02206 [Peptoniphilus asaccharolyticus DSM 20463]